LIRPSPQSKLGYKNWKRQSHDQRPECLYQSAEWLTLSVIKVFETGSGAN
jgi:hypothetical protein